jgi:two-component system sensor histidine kinase VicK
MTRQTLNKDRAKRTAADTVESAFRIFETSPVATLVVGPDSTKVKVSASQVGNEILLGVSDQGVGIAAENLESVFDPMYRIKHEGSEKIPDIGLGLFVCKGLIDSHGGRIWIVSKVGKWSTCWFTLPPATANT